jgi:hypothetical protein
MGILIMLGALSALLTALRFGVDGLIKLVRHYNKAV